MIFNSLYYEKRINNNNINTQYYNGFIETFFFNAALLQRGWFYRNSSSRKNLNV